MKRLFLAITFLAGATWLVASCSDDSHSGPKCGDGVCDSGETAADCPADCGCGNGVVNQGEQCDGQDMGDTPTCQDQGFEGGTLSCNGTCHYDTTQCTGGSQCGNGTKEGTEQCDKTDLGDQTCQDKGFDGGELGCDQNCHLDISGCCNDSCDTDGAKKCLGEVLQACQTGGTGCLAWINNTDCSTAGGHCVTDDSGAHCEIPCTNHCQTDGELRCHGDILQVCSMQGDCLDWADQTDCTTTQQFCSTDGGTAHCDTAPQGDRCANPIMVTSTPFTMDGTDITDDYTDAYDFSGTDCGTGHGAEAIFSIDLTSGQVLHMAETGSMDAVIRVLDTCDATAACLFSEDYGETDLSFVAPADGTYFVILEAYSSSSTSVDYHFTIDVPPPESQCGDGVDNDFDGDTDCEDSDCAGQGSCEATEATCNDSFDNDGDGDTDCADSDCAGQGSCEVTEATCNDSFDNDGDGDIDCADTDCFGQTGCTTEALCDDGADNDNDGVTDCADSDCQTLVACQPLKAIYQDFDSDDPMDLVAHSITFTRDTNNINGYTWAVTQDATTYPITPGSGTTSATMDLGDDESQAYAFATMTDGFPFYGTTYHSMFVASNGYIALGVDDHSLHPSAASFLPNGPKVGGYSVDLAPNHGGTITIDEFAHSVVVTYDQVPRYSSGELESFQIEMLDDGTIKFHYIHSELTDEGVVGITSGVGITPYPPETDFVPFAPADTVLINEVSYDNPTTVDANEFVELVGAPTMRSLDGYTLVHHDGDTGAVIWALPLDGLRTSDASEILIGPSTMAGIDISWAQLGLPNETDVLDDGPDSLVIYANWDGSSGDPVDAVEWETGASHSHAETAACKGVEDSDWNTSIGRYPAGHDTDDNSSDFFVQWWPTPGEPNNQPGPDSTYFRLTASTQSDEAAQFPVAIPDNDASGISVHLNTNNVTGFNLTSITDIQVGIKIRHTFSGDLIVTLTDPTGMMRELRHRSGSSTDNIMTVFDMVDTTDGSDLDDFNGDDPRGEWILNVSDNAGIDTGDLEEWVLWVK